MSKAREDILNRFQYHPPTTDAVREKHESIRNDCMSLAFILDGVLADGREKSLAITHLEEVMFWSNASIARAGA